jgi:hypothetical protein
MKNRNAWENDFRDFLDAEPAQVPILLTEKIAQRVQNELQPSSGRIFIKLVLIQAVAGSISLLFCPQFGIEPTSSEGLMPYLMPFGMGVCMVGCGALFTSLSFLFASIALRTEEVRGIRAHRWLQLSSVTALSLGALICAGGEVAAVWAIAWAMGSVIGGLAALELGWNFRLRSYRRDNGISL